MQGGYAIGFGQPETLLLKKTDNPQYLTTIDGNTLVQIYTGNELIPAEVSHAVSPKSIRNATVDDIRKLASLRARLFGSSKPKKM